MPQSSRRYTVTERTFDPLNLIYIVLVVLLLVGVIPFTHVAVGLVLLAGQVEAKVRF